MGRWHLVLNCEYGSQFGLLLVYVGCFDSVYTKEKLKTDTTNFNGIIFLFVLAGPALQIAYVSSNNFEQLIMFIAEGNFTTH